MVRKASPHPKDSRPCLLHPMVLLVAAGAVVHPEEEDAVVDEEVGQTALALHSRPKMRKAPLQSPLQKRRRPLRDIAMILR